MRACLPPASPGIPRSCQRAWLALLVALVLACAPTWAADGYVARVRARRAFQHDLVTLLALRSHARPLLGAALLARTRSDDGGPLGFHRLITRAAAAPDAGPAEQWVRLSDCDASADHCPNPRALKALMQQAPDNAAVWMLRMGQALGQGNASAAWDAIEQAAKARHYDDYTGRSLQALANAVALLPPPPDTLAGPGDHATRVAALQVAITFGIGAAQPMPGFRLVAAHCRPQAVHGRAQRHRLCLQLADVLVWGSSPLARSLGLHLRTTLSTDPAQRAQARADMRDLAWQVRQFALLQARARSDIRVAHRLLMLARQGGTEMAQILAALRAFGIPQHAPADGSLEPGTLPANAGTSPR